MNKAALFSVPRSGSSWLGQIFNSHPEVAYRFQPNFAYSFPLTLQENSTIDEINDFYQALVKTEDEFVNARISISNKRNHTFSKSHPSTLLFKETHYLNVIENLLEKSDTKIIGLVRSPFATINSWIKIPKEFDPSWDIENEWREATSKNMNLKSHYFGYNKWKEAILLFLKLEKKYSEQFCLINYDRLLLNPHQTVENLFQFCGLDFHPQTVEFLVSSKTRNDAEDAYSVFRKKEDDLQWRGELPEFIESEIEEDEYFQYLNKRFKWA